MLIFTHIPRTGGTTLRDILSRKAGKYTFIDSFASFSFTNDKELNSYSFIATHCGYGIFNRITKPHRKVILLRDPVERIVSHYYYLRNLPENVSYSSHYAKSLSLQQFVESDNPAIQIGINNTQTWHLIKDKNNYFRSKYNDVSEDGLLEMALNNLDSYDFIGFTDELGALLTDIGIVYGWKEMTEDIPCIRKSKRPDVSNLEESVVNVIDEKVQMDIALYKEMKIKMA